MMNNEQAIDKLQYLLGTLKDGEKGFSQAAEHADADSLKTLFAERSQQRGQFAGEVAAKIQSMGGDADKGGSVGAALHRTWLNVRDSLTGKGDYAVVAESERGEDVAIQNYQDVLNDAELPAELRSFVEGQYTQVKVSHDQIRDLKHSMKPD
ncbi:PA2169 family four-helix-bundle protein [Deinococcus arenicola]|uniref:PA2169 family four-helix-bundle protein n=1 Tax=Deinococcus arenicola TaxID=2994950 RepID=A0ABU4DR53_9DEIO|nr:PA2169 family four-helix-bundle protein [Deinococcus sp. ZS9-10]MDV6374179.1 PA2169 family four-helix-bundle protein [Deinococcus sp. ZS9-10]